MQERSYGRYIVESEIGKGAMGVVYRARDPMLDRMVAIKTILMAGSDRDDEQRFYQEARAAGRLNHPHIVTIYDIGKSDDIAYMAMELVDGDELRQKLRGGKPMPVPLAIEVAIGVAEGLGYAHEHGVVHRDVKPSNIMLLRDNRIKIMDFGIARMRETDIRTQTGLVLGSPRYMSPEQAVGKRVDARSDVFSLGVVLYEMLTGKPPFTGPDVNAIIYQTVNVQPPPPTTLNPAVPAIMDFIMVKALAKSAEERYATARDFAADLRDCRMQMAAAPAWNLGTPAQADFTRIDIDVAAAQGEGEDTTAEDEDARTLGLSRSFDSLDATMRLAAQTDTVQEVEEFITTQKRLAYNNTPDTHGTQPAIAPTPTGLDTTERLVVIPPANQGLSTASKIGLALAALAVLAAAVAIAFA